MPVEVKFKMFYAKSNELCHHGIKGQKWGIRRYQNPDGTLTEAGKKKRKTDWRGDAYTHYDHYRPKNKSERSMNITLDSLGGRRINAKYETRLKRGENLTKDGITKNEAVLRTIGRNVAKGAEFAGALLLYNYVLNKELEAGDYFSADVSRFCMNFLTGAAGLYTASSIIRGYQDVSDIDTYEKSKKR